MSRILLIFSLVAGLFIGFAFGAQGQIENSAFPGSLEFWQRYAALCTVIDYENHWSETIGKHMPASQLRWLQKLFEKNAEQRAFMDVKAAELYGLPNLPLP